MAKDRLEKFDLLPKGEHASGSYSPDDKAINLPVDLLNKAGKSNASAVKLAFVMWHKIQHSFNVRSMTRLQNRNAIASA